MRVFKIVFDNPNASYFAGQVVEGRVLIYLSKPKKIKALKLRCVGRAEIAWIERGSTSKTNCNRTGKEEYFTFDRMLLGEEIQDADILLPAGESSFPFYIQLPPGIPSSFQGAHGNVQYFLRATITRPWKFAQKVSSYFTVNGFLDLNLFGHASRSLTINKRCYVDTFSLLTCMCFCPTEVEYQLTLDKTGFVPGDTVGFNLSVNNRSSHRVSGIFLHLIHFATYKDTSGRYQITERKVVAEYNGPSVNSKSFKTWDSSQPDSGRGLKIPAVPPTNLGGGSLISLQYYLEVILRMSTFVETTVSSKVQLIIGTVPYRNFFEELMPSSFVAQQQQQQQQRQQVNDLQPTTTNAIPSQPNNITSLDFNSPPPSYAEAMELYSRYGATVPSPSAPLGESPEDQLIWEEDEAGFGRPFHPRYATYEWDRVNIRNSHY